MITVFFMMTTAMALYWVWSLNAKLEEEKTNTRRAYQLHDELAREYSKCDRERAEAEANYNRLLDEKLEREYQETFYNINGSKKTADQLV